MGAGEGECGAEAEGVLDGKERRGVFRESERGVDGDIDGADRGAGAEDRTEAKTAEGEAAETEPAAEADDSDRGVGVEAVGFVLEPVDGVRDKQGV